MKSLLEKPSRKDSEFLLLGENHFIAETQMCEDGESMQISWLSSSWAERQSPATYGNTREESPVSSAWAQVSP